ncbi:MAG TPA: efflux RND transporter periplasmic adaptor subunit [Pseudomonas xinjiangensis]|uniref:Efflux RND transporter periplasmic adaptor subunit n=2 Tax=root TaxID=1 RepID=A0A7V1FR26_9GAMM|nr:efflux RND transporter periplasmic adaptor subunit [Halopseudomonas xinjiangensis]HEC47405.1 efflux RND transporter periplasmic adaptor subunit [Halopseudomonas xinjiangensis]
MGNASWKLLQLVLGLTAFFVLHGCGGKDDPPAAATRSSTPIAAFEVRTEDLSRPLNVAAPVQPSALINLAARTAGTVQEVLYEEGDRVPRGQLLARLDVAEASAELDRAEAELASAVLDYERAVELQRRGVATQLEFQTARVAKEVAESHKALWESRVSYGRIEAPQDSMIIARHIEPGEAVQTQDTLFELANMERLVLRLGMSELDVVHLEPGQAMPLTFDALPEVTLEGRVRRIFPAAQGTSRLITVEIELPQSAWEQGVKPGFLARIDTTIDRRPDTLVVPAAAIGSSEQGHYVYAIKDDRLQRRQIETGISRSRWTEVLNGVEPGEMILASNPIDMADDQAVRVVTTHE